MRGQLLLKGVELTGGLRDHYLALQQCAENEIEYLKAEIIAHSAFKNAEVVNRSLERLRFLLGLKGQGKKKDEWMDDPAKAKAGMEFLKKLSVIVG